MKTIILASASPRRKELLKQIGLKFKVVPSEYEESLDSGLDPHELAQRLSLEKANSVARIQPDALVIAADTLGVLNGKVLGKPHTESEARKMLAMLSGKAHSVITGFTIMDAATNKSLTRTVETRVYLRKLTSGEIDAYVKSGEPLDKVGGYAIQGLGAVIVERIEGDYFNVVGLPLRALAKSLKEFGVKVLQAGHSSF